MRVLYFDTETTGTNPEEHELIQIGGIIEIDGKVEEEFSLNARPLKIECIDPKALALNGLPLAEVANFPEPRWTFDALIRIFEKYVDRRHKETRLIPAGYNVEFDLRFLQAFMLKVNPDNKWGLHTWMFWRPFDMLAFLRNRAFYLGMEYPDLKLGTVAKENGLEELHQAHDALSDARVTRALMRIYAAPFYAK